MALSAQTGVAGEATALEAAHGSEAAKSLKDQDQELMAFELKQSEIYPEAPMYALFDYDLFSSSGLQSTARKGTT